MTLLSICRDVLAETGWPILGGIASNSDATAQQIYAIARAELSALCEDYNWPHLEVEYNFPTVAGQSLYMLPADCRILAPDAIFNADEYYRLRGSTGMQFWQLLKYGKLGNLSRIRFRIKYPFGAPAIELTPTPDTVQNLVAVYYSKNYALNDTNAEIENYTTDTDVSKIPERYVKLGVKWRFRRSKGLDFSTELSEYNTTIAAQYAKYRANGSINVGGRRPIDPLTPGYVPENGFGQQ